MVPPSTFPDHVQRVVDDFLQSVVVVDDQAFESSRRSSSTVGPEEGQTGGQGRGVRGGLKAPPTADEHDLDPKAVTDAFANAGLVCSLLSPRENEAVDERLLKTARRADLVVLDWVLNRDEGRKTLALLSALLSEDEAPPRRRLRTVAIYTGQQDLDSIAIAVAAKLEEIYIDCRLKKEDGGLTMTKGPVRIGIFAKEAVPNLPPRLKKRRLGADKLVVRLRQEFSKLASGLITAVALEALAALRDDTHRILTALGPDLDAAYLGHRSVLPDPEDAERQALELVASEIYSVLESNRIDQGVGLDVLKLWVAHSRGRVGFGRLIEDKPLTAGHVDRMLEFGLGTDEGAERVADQSVGKNHFKRKVKPRATQVFSASKAAAERSDAQFFHRMALRTAYAEPPKTLQLGTIVANKSGAFRLCVQPVCDSVRLTEARPFPFLKLSKVRPAGPADFVVPHMHRSGWLYLSLGRFPRDLEMIDFDPRSARQIVATTQPDGKHLFKSLSGDHWEWVADLKPGFAQKVAVELAERFARVGVDEAELLRLSRG